MKRQVGLKQNVTKLPRILCSSYSVEKLINEWVNELMIEGIKCSTVSKMMAILSLLLSDPVPVQWNYAAQNHPIVTWMVSF